LTANPARRLSLGEEEIKPLDENVKQLLAKAAEQKEAHLAMHFAQAALNAAHALQILQQMKKNG